MNLLGKKQILEAAAIALLTAVGNKIKEHLYKKLNKEKEDEKVADT